MIALILVWFKSLQLIGFLSFLAAAVPVPRTLPAGSTSPVEPLGISGHHQEAYGWGWAAGHGLTMAALTWAIKTAHFSLPTTLALFVARKVFTFFDYLL